MDVKLSQPVLIAAQADDFATGLFARAKIFDASNALLSTVPLPHVSNGLYQAVYTPAALGYQTVVAQFFTDVGFTTPDVSHGGGQESLRVLINDADSLDVDVGAAVTAANAAAVATTITRKIALNEGAVVGNQFIIYDDDLVTPFKTWNLFDDLGNPTSTRIFKRVPV